MKGCVGEMVGAGLAGDVGGDGCSCRGVLSIIETSATVVETGDEPAIASGLPARELELVVPGCRSGVAGCSAVGCRICVTHSGIVSIGLRGAG